MQRFLCNPVRRTSTFSSEWFQSRKLKPSCLAAHGTNGLVLLSSESDTVHRVSLRETRLSTPQTSTSPHKRGASVWHHPPYSGLGVQRAATSPASTVRVSISCKGRIVNGFFMKDARLFDYFQIILTMIFLRDIVENKVGNTQNYVHIDDVF